MKMLITQREWWPVMTPVELERGVCGREAEVPEELLARWKAAVAEMDSACLELRKLYDASTKEKTLGEAMDEITRAIIEDQCV